MDHSSEYEVAFRLPRRRGSVPRARALAHGVLHGWGVASSVVEDAKLMVSELVTNALKVRAPADRQVGLRLVRLLPEGLLRLEISDAGAGKPEVCVPDDDKTSGRGLLLVQALAHRWGVEARPHGIGKTVWAEIKAPKAHPAHCGREMAAVTVQPGQIVRLWGSWHTIRSVRSECYPSGGLAVVLGLDDGGSLRLPAAELLTVREGGASEKRGHPR